MDLIVEIQVKNC